MARNCPQDGTAQPDQAVQRSALVTEPLSRHSVETMLAACRAAITNGEDVNALDTVAHVGYNEGRPLDACLRQAHMPGKRSIIENLPAIELLLDHGADPRLHARSVGVAAIPMILAKRYSVDEEKEEHRACWRNLLGLFEEAIIRIDANEKHIKENTLENPDTLAVCASITAFGSLGVHRIDLPVAFQ